STNFMVGPRAASPLAPERPRESLRASGVHRHLLALFTQPLVLHDAIDGRIQGEVSAELHVLTRVDDRPELANQDAAGVYRLAGVHLHAPPLPGRVAPVSRRSLSLFMSPFAVPSKNRIRTLLPFCKGLAVPAPSTPTLFLFSEVQHPPVLLLPENLTNDFRARENRPPHFGFA